MNGFLKHWRDERALERERAGDTPEKLAEEARAARRPAPGGDVGDATKRASLVFMATTAQPPV
jgi:hypothetical protein